MWGREDLAARLQFQWELDLGRCSPSLRRPVGAWTWGRGLGAVLTAG